MRGRAALLCVRTVAALVVLGVGCTSVGCRADDGEAPAPVAKQFYAAVAAKDGAGVCVRLSAETIAQLEKDEQAPCPEAIGGLDLSGRRAVASDVYVTAAKVDLEGGDSVFLDESRQGWRIAAAGCRPQSGEEAPYDCVLES